MAAVAERRRRYFSARDILSEGRARAIAMDETAASFGDAKKKNRTRKLRDRARGRTGVERVGHGRNSGGG